MKFEIDIDLPVDMLREWEPVAFRVPMKNETFVTQDGQTHVMPTHGTKVIKQRIILRRRFQWPSWLKCRYLTWDVSGSVNCYLNRPQLIQVGNMAWSCFDVLSTLPRSVVDVPFPGGDWRTRIEENPSWKGGE